MNSNDALLLGLDLGTTNVKALVTDWRGTPRAEASLPVRLYHAGEGRVEQDMEEIWLAARGVMAQVARTVEAGRIRAVGVSSQGGTLQLLKGDGQPAGRAISWLDERARSQDAALTAELGRAWFRQRIGHGRSGLVIGQLLRLQREFPADLRPPRRFGFVGDVIVSRLCGRAAHDSTSCGLTLLHNPALRAYDPDVLARLGVAPEQLPALLSPREAAGGLVPHVADETGLPAGIPVSAAIHDQYAAALGTGAVEPGTVMVGAGTAWVLLAVSRQLAPPIIDEAFVCTHVVDDLFGQMLSLVNGGSALSWALQIMGLESAKVDDIDRLLETAPPGSEGLSFWPFLTPVALAGLAADTLGRLAGLQLAHNRAHLVRAVVEGLVLELNRHLGFLRRANLPLRFLVMGGAVAGSQATPQIMADITGLPVVCLGAGAGSLLGAAILARGLLEPQRTLDGLAAEMIPAGRTVLPGRAAPGYRDRFAAYMASLPLAQGDDHHPTTSTQA